MEKTKCIIIVGKPGAGKSTIASLLSEHLPADYTSLGSFMREVIGIPDPHIGVDKNPVYEALHSHLLENASNEHLILDCHPYPEEDLLALEAFLSKSNIELSAILQVVADDAVALTRLQKRPRPGQKYEDRLTYFNDNKVFIDRLAQGRDSLIVENNNDLPREVILEEIVNPILDYLRKKTDA